MYSFIIDNKNLKTLNKTKYFEKKVGKANNKNQKNFYLFQ